jgi:4,5-DOPA dioxygenase extradiol
LLPSLFIAHGAPTLAIESSAYTRFLDQLAKELPRPNAIVIFSAHWESAVQAVSHVLHYETIHDFYGFPEEMYQIHYPAKGHLQLAERIEQLLQAENIPTKRNDKRGLDHGAWVVLRLLYPNADIPVVALSVNPFLPPEEQYRIGKTLSPLRQEDILIIGSGGTVHNLYQVNFRATQADDWAIAFDDWLADSLQRWDLERLFRYETLAPHARQAVPRNEHFIPLLYAMGAADDERQARSLFRAYQFGSLSLSCWQFGKSSSAVAL